MINFNSYKKGQGAKTSIPLVTAILTDENLCKCKFTFKMFKLDVYLYKRHCQIFNFEIQSQNITKKLTRTKKIAKIEDD